MSFDVHPRRWALLALHLGVAVMLAGAVLDARRGRRTDLDVPLLPGHLCRASVFADGRVYEAPFALGPTQVSVDFYPPEYTLFRGNAGNASASARMSGPFRLPPGGTLDLGADGRVTATELRDESGAWRHEVPLASGGLLRRQPPVVRDYRLRLQLRDSAGVLSEAEVSVNHPLHYRGWLVYLEAIHPGMIQQATLILRQAPGRPLVIAGIWITLAATTFACLARMRNDHATR